MSQTAKPAQALTAEQALLVEEHLPLVRRLARKWRTGCRQQVEHGDLVQVGTLGLMEAARRYDAKRQQSFAAFAQARIQGAIRDALRALDPLTRDERQDVRRLEEARDELRVRLQREPEEEELAERLGWSVEDVRDCQGDLCALQDGLARTLAEPILMEQDDSPFGSPAPDAYRSVLRAELRRAVCEAVEDLPERQRLVLSLYYDRELTMRDVGDVLSVTESRVSQLHSAAITNLRARLGSLEPTAAVA